MTLASAAAWSGVDVVHTMPLVAGSTMQHAAILVPFALAWVMYWSICDRGVAV